MPDKLTRRLQSTARLIPVILVCSGLSGCVEKAPPRPTPARADASLQLNVPRILRGTIASETIMLGYQPVVVRGYGLVVGLDGTGSRDIPPAVRAHMLAEMARHGIGKESAGLGHLNPEQMLDSPNTAVVVVEAVIPPGAVGREVLHQRRIEGTRFDVRVFADPRTGTTSLEGGRLYTAELRPVQPGETLPPTGSRQAAAVAEAGGPIFVNPFAEPGADNPGMINRNTGRILNGGVATKDMPLKLRLATPSHTRAAIVQNSLNTRFPQEPGQSDPTARGVSDELINITVPPSFRDKTDDFVELLRHTTIRSASAEGVANSIRRVLIDDPGAAYEATWRWYALGQRALPSIREVYDHPEEQPRMAALSAGARLEDPLVTPHLIRMTESESADTRRRAVQLLGDMKLDPRIDQALYDMMNDEDVDVRLAAYESLTKRAAPFITRHDVDGKFVVEVVESDKPMIYVTQLGQPRVAVFGRDLAIDRPALLDAWSGRFILQAEEGDEMVEVYYRPNDGGERVIERTDPTLVQFIQFLGHQTTIEKPEPGLGLSYGETIGAVYQIWLAKYIQADFRAEQDRILAAILRQRELETPEERPEFADPDFDFLKPEEGALEPPEEEVSSLDQLAPPPSVGR
jgi:hypothetical protein